MSKLCQLVLVIISMLMLAGFTTHAAYIERYSVIANGAVTMTGNAIGLAKNPGQNQPGTSGSIGAFITTDTTKRVGTYPNGTTLLWSQNSSAANLTIPAGSTVLYAELVWAGSYLIPGNTGNQYGDVSSYINNAITLKDPLGGTHSISPDPATADVVYSVDANNVNNADFYVRSADVTTLIQSYGAGTYTASGIPATVLAAEDSNNGGGWTLVVVYQNNSLHQRNMTVWVGAEYTPAGGPTPAPSTVNGFCTPPSGPVSARLLVSAIEGDANITGDQMLFGLTTGTMTAVSGANNPVNNFFGDMIENDSGAVATTGTFGTYNSDPNGGNTISGARQGWDIANVDVSAQVGNNATTAAAQGTSAGDGFTIHTLAMQIDVGSPSLTSTQSVDKTSTYVGDTLHYTVVVTNAGNAAAVNLLYTDPLPQGTAFVTNGLSFATNGVVIPGANPVNGVIIPYIGTNSSLTLTYAAQVNTIPSTGPAQYITAGKFTFQFQSCANAPVNNQVVTSPNVITAVPRLAVTKGTSLTNVIPNAILTYTILTPNTGTTNTAIATLIDQIPAGTTYIPGTTTENGASLADLSGGIMPFTVKTPIYSPGQAPGVILVGATNTVVFQVRINTNPVPITINNVCTVQTIGTNSATATQAGAVIAPVICDLAVGETVAPSIAVSGSTVTYVITVTNLGPNNVSQVTNMVYLATSFNPDIKNLVYTPSQGTYTPSNNVWSGVPLNSGNVITLTVSGTLSAATLYTNLAATAVVTGPAGITDANQVNNSTGVTNPVVGYADLIVAIADGVTNVHPGDPISLTFTVTNAGPTTVNNLNMLNTLSPYITNIVYNLPTEGTYVPVNGNWNGLNLYAGGPSISFVMTATVLTSASQNITNVATVSSILTDPNLTNNIATDIDYFRGLADLSINKTGPTNTYVGGTYSYNLAITNSGYSTASNVVVIDSMPTNLVFVSASNGGIVSNITQVVWSMSSLAAYTATNLTLTVQVNSSQTGSITNSANVVSSTDDPVLANNQANAVTTVSPAADIVVTKSGPATVLGGSNLVYIVSVTNLGPSAVANLIVRDSLPTNVTYVSSSGGGTFATNTVTWSFSSLGIGNGTNYTVTATAPIAATSLTNTASATALTYDPNTTNNNGTLPAAQVVTVVAVADIQAYKTGPSSIGAGTNYSYTLTITNAGPSSASNVIVSDVLKPMLAIVASGNGAITATNISWTIPVLAAGTATNIILTVTPPGNGSVTNTISATSQTPDPQLSNNNGTATNAVVITAITPNADVQVFKTGPGNVPATTAFAYSIVVTNAGPSTAANVVVVDQMPPSAQVTYNNNTGGGVWSGAPRTITWTLGSLAANTGTNFVVNATTRNSGLTFTNYAYSTATTSDPNPGNNSTTNAAAIVITIQKGTIISGNVYNDINNNGFMETTETGIGVAGMYVKLVPQGSSVAIQAAVVTNTTGGFSLTNVAGGNYNLILDGNNTLTDITPSTPAGWTGTEQPNQIRAVFVNDVDLPNQDFGLIQAGVVTGVVFSDTGIGSGAANNGVQDGGELGLANVIVKLTNAGGTTNYATSTTDGGGNFTLKYPSSLATGTQLKIVCSPSAGYMSVAAAVGTTAGTYSRLTDTLTFTTGAGTSYTGIAFGRVPFSQFTADGQQAGMPAGILFYPHTFIAGTAGTLTFTINNTANPVNSGWSYVIYRDAACNGTVANDAVITSGISVNAGDNICIIVKQFIPANAPIGAIANELITATLTFANIAISTNLTHVDLTTVGTTTTGLTLTKVVDKASALPGDSINYTLNYMNESVGSLTNVTIFDSTPSFTTFVGYTNGVMPANLTGVIVTAPTVGGVGSIKWVFTGALAPSSTGSVQFTVKVNQ